MILKLRPGLALLAACLTAGAFALTPLAQAAAPSISDTLKQIHQINLLEIHLANTALKNTKDPEVTEFAHRMIKDHSAADEKTERVALTRGIELPGFQPSAEERATMKRLQKLKGTAFDAAYMDAMKSGHQAAIQFLTSADLTMQDRGVKSLISEILPTVRHHERMATTIAANIDRTQHQFAGEAASGNPGRAGH